MHCSSICVLYKYTDTFKIRKASIKNPPHMSQFLRLLSIFSLAVCLWFYPRLNQNLILSFALCYVTGFLRTQSSKSNKNHIFHEISILICDRMEFYHNLDICRIDPIRRSQGLQVCFQATSIELSIGKTCSYTIDRNWFFLRI